MVDGVGSGSWSRQCGRRLVAILTAAALLAYGLVPGLAFAGERQSPPAPPAVEEGSAGGDEVAGGDAQPAEEEPATGTEPPAGEEPSAGEEPPAGEEPSAGEEPPVGDEPAAGDEPPVAEEPPAPVVEPIFIAAPHRAGEIIVKRRAPSNPGRMSLSAAAAPAGPELVQLTDGQTVGEALALLQADPGVEYAEPNYERTIMAADPLQGEQWNLEPVQAPSAWEWLDGQHIEGVVRVAVIDTGVDAGHPDLAGRVGSGRNFSGSEPNNDSADRNGHGTHVAGIIAARTGNGTGIAGLAGHANVEILPVKAVGDDGTGTAWSVAQAIRWAVDAGADVINISLGGTGHSTVEQEAIAYARARSVVVVAAAGNSTGSVDLFYPASFPGVIAVGAVDQNLEPAYFSSPGRALDLMAPGVEITAPFPSGLPCEAPRCFVENGASYATFDGTSFAAPHVTAAAALLTLANPNIMPPEVEDRLKAFALDMGAAGRDDESGYGLLQMADALSGGAGTGIHFLTPVEGSTVWGVVDLQILLDRAELGSAVRFADQYGNEIGYAPAPTLLGGREFHTTWNSAALTGGGAPAYPDGPYTITAQLCDDSGNPIEGRSESIEVTVANQTASGLRLQVRNPDGSAADGAVVAVFHQTPSADESVEAGYWYEPAYQGETDSMGQLPVPGSWATSGHAYTVVVRAEQADGSGVIYVRPLDGPGTMVIDGSSATLAEIRAFGREGLPLAQAESWVAVVDGQGVRLPFPLPAIRLDDSGEGRVYLDPGRYDFHVRSEAPAYFLTKREVVVGGTQPLSILFMADEGNTTRLTVSLAGFAGASEGYLYLWEPYFLYAYAIPVAAGESVVVSSVEASVVARLWVEQGGKTWNYLAESNGLINIAGPDLTLQLGHAMQAEVIPVVPAVAPGETFLAGTRFADDQGFFYRDVQYAVGSLGISSAGVQRLAVRTGAGERVDYQWEQGTQVWVRLDRGATAGASLTWNFVDPELRVVRLTGSGAEEVATASSFDLYHWLAWDVPTTAAPGEYRADLTLRAGPLGTVAGSGPFTVESQQRVMTITNPDGSPASGASLRLIYRDEEQDQWSLAFSGTVDGFGTFVLPSSFQLAEGQQYWLQVESIMAVDGVPEAVGLNRPVTHLSDLLTVDGSRARPLAIRATHYSDADFPLAGAEVVAQPVVPGLVQSTSEQRPNGLSMLLTRADGRANLWLDPGEYHINATFHWPQTGEGYFLVGSATVPVTGSAPELWLRGDQTAAFALSIDPPAGSEPAIETAALVVYSDLFQTGMSYPYSGPAVIRVTPGTYRTYAIVLRRSDPLTTWGWWEQVDPTVTVAAGDTVDVPFGTTFAASLTLDEQPWWLPGSSTVTGHVAITDAHGNRLGGVWVENCRADQPCAGEGRVSQGALGEPPAYAEDGSAVAQNHWEISPFLSVTDGSGTLVFHEKSPSQFVSVGWPVPGYIPPGTYSAQVAVQTGTEEWVRSDAAAFTVAGQGLSIDSPATGHRTAGDEVTVSGTVPPVGRVQLFMAKGPSPSEDDYIDVGEASYPGPTSWTKTIALNQGDGPYHILAKTVAEGRELVSNAITVVRDAAVAAAPTLEAAALDDGHVRLRWTGEPGKAVRNVLVYRAEGEAAERPADPLVTLPAEDRMWVDPGVADQTTYSYWVASVDEWGVPQVSTRAVAHTPGLFWLKPTTSLTEPKQVRGFVDLEVSVEAYDRLGAVRFSLGGEAGGPVLAVVSTPVAGRPDLFRYQWDTTTVPDGGHVVRAELMGSDLTTVLFSQRINVTVANAVATGLQFHVHNPDGTAGQGAEVTVWYRDPGGEDYELVGSAAADDQGWATIPGAVALDQHRYLAAALAAGSEPAYYLREATAPKLVTLGPPTAAVTPVTVRAEDRTGGPLSGAEIWAALTTASGRLLLPPVRLTGAGGLAPSGQISAYLAPGTYSFYAIDRARGYFLTRRQVTVAQAPVSILIDGLNTTEVTASLAGSGTLDSAAVSVESPDSPALGVTGSRLTVSSGTYRVHLDAAVREEDGSTLTFTLADPNPRTLTGPSISLLFGGPLQLSLAPPTLQVQPGSTFQAGVTVTDQFGFHLTASDVGPAVQVTRDGEPVTDGSMAASLTSAWWDVPVSAADGDYRLQVSLDAGALGQPSQSVAFRVLAGERVILARLDETTPAAGAQVRVLEGTGSGWSTRFAGATAPDGSLLIPASLSLVDGASYLIQLEATTAAGERVALNRIYTAPLSWPLTLSAAEARPITVTATGSEGDPLTGARVMLQPDAAGSPPLDLGLTDATGTARGWVDPGTYTVAAARWPAAGLDAYWLIARGQVLAPAGALEVALDGAAARVLDVQMDGGIQQVTLVAFAPEVLSTGVAFRFELAAGGDLHLSEGAYRLFAEVVRTADAEWRYWEVPPGGEALNITAADPERQLAFGSDLTATLALDRDTWMPEETLTGAVSFADEHGNRLLRAQVVTCAPSGCPGGSFAVEGPGSVPVFVTAPLGEGAVLVQAGPELAPFFRIYKGEELLAETRSTGYYAGAVEWRIPLGAAGEHRAEVALQAGPIIRDSVTFTVAPGGLSVAAPKDGSWLNTDGVRVSGRAAAGAQVRVYFGYDTTPLRPNGSAATTADATGTWEVEVLRGGADGAYALYAEVAQEGAPPLWSEVVHFVIDRTPPPQPWLTGTAVSYRQVELSWTSSSGEPVPEILIYRTESGSVIPLPPELEPLARLDGSARTYRDETVNPGASYVYWAVCLDRAGNRRSSEPVLVLVPEGIALTAVTFSTPRAESGHAQLGQDVVITARGDAGQVAQAYLQIGGLEGTQPVLLTEGDAGVYTGRFTLEPGMTAIEAVAARLARRDDPDRVTQLLAAPGTPVPVGGSVSGKVASGGAGVSGAQVTAWSAALGAGAWTRTGADGTYRIDGLAPGSYALTVRSQDGSQVHRLEGASTVAAGELKRTDVDLPVYYTVEVVVAGAGGGLAGVRVLLANESDYSMWRVTDASGTATFPDVPAADYTVRTQDAPLVGYYDRTGSLSASAFSPTSPALRFALEPLSPISYGTITGTVDAGGKALAGVLVSASSESARADGHAVTGDDGRYTISGLLPATDYQLSFSHASYPAAQITGVALAAGETVTVNRSLAAGYEVSGSVTGHELEQIPPDTVLVRADGPGFTAWTPVDQAGNFRFESLPAGTYTFTTVNDLGYGDGSITTAVPLAGGLTLSLTPQHSVGGLVRSDTGDAVAGATVEAWRDGRLRWTLTDGEGRYRIAGLASGTYALRATAPGYGEATLGSVAVTAPDTAAPDLILPAIPAFADAETGFGVSPTAAAPGSSVTFRGSYRYLGAATLSDAALHLPVPAGTQLLPDTVLVGGQPVGGTVLVTDGGAKYVSVPLGNLQSGAAGDFTYKMQVLVEVEGRSSQPLAASIHWTGGSAQLGRPVTLELMATTLEGPATTSSRAVTLTGRAVAGARVRVFDGSLLLGETLSVEGRWRLDAMLTGEPVHELTAVAEIGGSPSRPSNVLRLTYDPDLPRVTGVTVTGGYSGTVSGVPFTQPVAAVASEFTDLRVEVQFDPASPAPVSPVVEFMNRPHALTPLNGVYTASTGAEWSGFGVQPVTLIFRDGDGEEHRLEIARILVLIDPNGYAYEGVPDSRVSGVAATIEHKVGGEWQLWNAVAFGMVNPEVTDAQGRYGWDVPAGTWRVTFTSPDYETYVTTPFDVPPPKTGLNVGLIAKAPPRVVDYGPGNGAAQVPVTTAITVAFDRYMRVEDVTAASIRLVRHMPDGSLAAVPYQAEPVDAAANPAAPSGQLARSFKLIPLAALEHGARYTVTVEPLIEAYSGRTATEAVSWSFTTAARPSGGGGGGGYAPPDRTPPGIEQQRPEPGAVDVEPDVVITVTWSEAIAPESVSAGLLDGTSPVPASVSVLGATLSITPSSPLTEGKTYTVTIEAGVSDLAGNAVAEPITWSFTVRAPVDDRPEWQFGRLELSADGTAVTALVDPDSAAAVEPNSPVLIDLTAVPEAAAETRGVAIPVRTLRTWRAGGAGPLVLRTGLGTFQLPLSALLDTIAVRSAAADAVLHIQTAPAATPELESALQAARDAGFVLDGTPTALSVLVCTGERSTAVSELAQKVSAALVYTKGALPHNLVVYRLEGSRLVLLGGKADPEAGTVQARTNSTGTFLLLGLTREFSDVAGNHPARKAIQMMVARQVIQGFPDGTFRPGENLTRAQFSALLVRALRLERLEPFRPTFTDVRPGDWFYGDVEAAARAGLIQGFAGEFRPNDRVTRQEAAIILRRALALRTQVLPMDPAARNEALRPFVDRGQIADWAAADVAQLVARKVMPGRTPAFWQPLDWVSRAEAAVIITEMLSAAGEL